MMGQKFVEWLVTPKIGKCQRNQDPKSYRFRAGDTERIANG